MADAGWGKFLIGGLAGFGAGIVSEPLKFWVMRRTTRQALQTILYRDIFLIQCAATDLFLKTTGYPPASDEGETNVYRLHALSTVKRVIEEWGIGPEATNAERYRAIADSADKAKFYELPESVLISNFYRQVQVVQSAISQQKQKEASLDISRLKDFELLSHRLFNQRIVDNIYIELGVPLSQVIRPLLFLASVQDLLTSTEREPYVKAKTLEMKAVVALEPKFGTMAEYLGMFVLTFAWIYFEIERDPRILLRKLRSFSWATAKFLTIFGACAVLMYFLLFRHLQ